MMKLIRRRGGARLLSREKIVGRMRAAHYTLKKQLHLIPHLFTLGNALFGFASVVMVATGYPEEGAYFILLGALLDALDGRIARLVGSSSPFGVELDSLADIISFCFAPSFLLYHTMLYRCDPLGFVSAALFLLTGMIRLARFNILHNEQSIFFMGIPTTIAGCFLTTISLLCAEVELPDRGIVALIILQIMLAFLMVSRIRFPTFKNINKRLYGISVALLVGFSIIMGLLNVLVLLFVCYFMFSIYLSSVRCVRAWWLSNKQ